MPARFFEQLCGRFKISEEQQEVFQEFSRAMRQCSLAFFLVSASNIILTISQVHLLILLLGCIGLMHFQFLPYASTLQCRSPVMIQSQ